MARFLFVTWDGGGNVPPAIGVAQELRERGHAVAFAGQELRERAHDVSSAGPEPLQARCLERGFRFKRLDRSSAAWSEEPPQGRIVTALMACPAHLHDLPATIAHEPCDVLVVDCLMFGALAAAEDTSLPVAVLVHSAPGLLMAPGGPMEAFLLAAVNEVRTTAGRAAVSSLWEAWARFPALCTTIPELDPLAAQAPSSFDYVGPIFESVPASGWHAPWPADDPRPLVLVSFTSSAGWDQTSRIRRTLEALAGTRYRVLVTTSLVNVAGLPVPENAVLVRHIPHAEILPKAAVMVTHAGHGTVVAALAHGVPVVSLPNPAADQPGIAAQVEALGAGRALDGESATPEEIAQAVDQVLRDRSYAVSAKRLAAVIAAAPGVETAAARLERLADHSPHRT